MSPPDGHIADPDAQALLDEAAQAVEAPPSPRALASAYLDYRDWLRGVLALRYGQDVADDLAQDTYLRVHAYEPAAPVRSPQRLLMRIALNLASNRRRKADREIPIAPDDKVLTRLPSPSTQEEAAHLTKMLLALPPKLRDVFVLNHVRGLTYREIAALRGISAKAVEKRMSQAIARCAKLMRP
ncbi:RNA polymerase subunit sigma-70 [Caulobacter radicis]|uniref:RNA polymerase sigma factor n=1 Tax=Caulobacter radicis TaxID=2172650 RepID=UPI000D564AC1|nr:RNA polymerase sigma factor [Caulobacter radicis]PVM91760.1 RNA polymerase subunit sigma-70 [Caulobacter radicis]